LALVATPGAPAESIGQAMEDGTFHFDGRLRFERVRQTNFTEDANALTFRARFGFETAPFKGFKILAEGDFTRALGIDGYNSTVNGKTGVPVIADPVSARLNRAALAFIGLPQTTVSAGRQYLLFDDARFIALPAAFRQNEPSFDSVSVKTEALPRMTFNYAFVWRVNQVFGSRSPQGHVNGGIHLLNASYSGLPVGTVTAYAYLIGLDSAPSSSSQTYGVRLTGKQTFRRNVDISYAVGFARQADYKNNAGNFALAFLEAEGGISYKKMTLKAGYQKLGGNGTAAFQTPLGTLHAFQGFADQFVTTPRSGIQDAYVQAGFKTDELPLLGTVGATVWFHDFSPDRAGPDLGEGIDFLVSAAPKIHGRRYVFSFTHARFYGSPIMPDVNKIWLTAEVAF